MNDLILASSALVMKARATQEIAANILSKREFTAHVSDIQRQLKEKTDFKAKFVNGTRDEEARFMLFSSKQAELLLVVFENGQLQAEYFDKLKDKSNRGKKSRLLNTVLKDVTKFFKRLSKSADVAPGNIKPVKDRTTRNPKVARKVGMTVATIPDFKNSAVKARNWIQKITGAKATRSMGNSNPYSDVQLLNIVLTPPQKMKLDKAFKEAEIKLTNTRTPTTLCFNQGELDIYIPTKSYKAFSGKTLYDIGIYGKKKAKRSNLPYYD